MMAQKSIAKTPIPDAFTGQSGYWWYGATCAAVFESAERFSKAQPPQGWHSPLLRRYRKEPQALHFTFTGKEKDPETGYSYFGARHLEHDLMAGWLSVDPMADKHPSISPYAYCAWNPVKLVDPKGKEVEYSSFRDWFYVLTQRMFNKGFRLRYKDLRDSKEVYVPVAADVPVAKSCGRFVI